MKFSTFLLWILLFVLCWPLALLALVLYPLVWLLSLPLKVAGIGVEAILATIRAVVMLPARVLGERPRDNAPVPAKRRAPREA